MLFKLFYKFNNIIFFKIKNEYFICFYTSSSRIISAVNATEVNTSKNANNTISNNTITNNQLPKEESAASTLVDIKDGQLKTIDDYKAKYGSDTYGMVAYILHLVQVYSIPIGLVGIAFCAIFEYVIGMKRLDIRDKGFNSMIAAVTIIIICQILPLIFAVVVKSTD